MSTHYLFVWVNPNHETRINSKWKCWEKCPLWPQCHPNNIFVRNLTQGVEDMLSCFHPLGEIKIHVFYQPPPFVVRSWQITFYKLRPIHTRDGRKKKLLSSTICWKYIYMGNSLFGSYVQKSKFNFPSSWIDFKQIFLTISFNMFWSLYSQRINPLWVICSQVSSHISTFH